MHCTHTFQILCIIAKACTAESTEGGGGLSVMHLISEMKKQELTVG